MRQIASKVTTSTPTSKDENTPSFEGKKKSSKLTVIIVVIIILIGLAAIIRFNVGNLAEKYLRSLLENIPIVNNILPPLDKEIDKYSNYSKEKLLKELNTLKNQLESKDEQLLSYQNTFERLEAEIKRLREIEEQQIQFKIEKNEFSKMVAQEDPKAFIEFFKTFYPETATEIYKELIIEEFRTQEIKDMLNLFKQWIQQVLQKS